MATGTVTTRPLPPPPPAAGGHVEHERVIQRQLGRTTWHVRIVDLASGLAAWAIGVIAFFFFAALFDHWIGLGVFGRLASLALLVGCSLYYLLLYIGPLLVRSINPTYAAHTIEEATPTLKNSLVNFLLLKQDRQGLKEIVFQAVERQAARDIAVVPVEATVDRTRMIHAGYVLCGVMALFAAYKILSPKDPFQSVARVLAPWADIARPSRVQISDVQPGSAEVYLGQTQKISAIIRGNREDETVVLRYTTADGQAVNQPVAMALAAGGLRHECVLPPPEAGSVVPSSGLLQDISYRIVAGDAESSTFRLTVISAPTIIVDRLHYQFPPYTKRAAETAAQHGDIRALEGTKVTIQAIANQPIKSAWIEFDPAADDSALERVQLAAEGSRASGTITLQLKPDRQTPWRGAYQVRFYNERGQRSQQPILHKIDVIRDLPPEVQILQPERLRVEVPADGEQKIEVRAVDPDFGLSRLRIEGTVGGRPAVNIDLLQPESVQPPQATVPYLFRPRDHKLKAGDELTYVAVAEDNRTSPQTGQPEPNVARTKAYTLVVLAPQSAEGAPGDANKQPMPGGKPEPGANERQPAKQQPGDKQQPMNAEGDKGGEQKQPEAQNQEPKKNQPQQGGKNNQSKQPQQGGDQKQDGQKQDSKQPGGQQAGEQQPGGQQAGEQQPGDQQKSDQQKGQQQSGDQQQGKSQPGGQAGGQQSKQQDGQQQAGDSGGANAAGSPQQSNPMKGGAGDASQQPGQSGGQPSGDSQQPAGQQGDPQADPSGQPNGSGREAGPAHDGRAIEELLKEIEQEKEGQKPQQGGGKSQIGQSGKQNAGQQPEQQDGAGDKQKGQQQGDQRSSAQPGSAPQAGGKSGGEAQNTPATGKPGGNDQKLDPAAQDKQGKGEPEGKKEPDATQRMPDDKLGQNPSAQKGGGNKGGAPQGPSKTDKSEPSPPSSSEDRDPGAGNNGDEGAGTASKDKSGSGTGVRQNQDYPKELKPESNRPEEGDPGTPNISKKQRDMKSGQAGDESGGGKQGPGAPARQPGNDSAGTQSAADQGAGKAEESGKGETGDKAGDKQKAAGKTGQSGDEAGKGSTSRAAEQGQEGGPQAGQPQGPQDQGGKGELAQPQAVAPGPPPDGAKSGDPSNQGQGKGGSYQPSGGGDGVGESSQQRQPENEGVADAANLEYARKATEMVLKRLKDEEHNPDPELLDKLGWTREDLAEFLRRWDALQKSAQENQDGKRELDEALKSLGLRDPALRKRIGGQARDNQRDLRDAGNRTAPPSRYRDLFDAFRKGAARSRE